MKTFLSPRLLLLPLLSALVVAAALFGLFARQSDTQAHPGHLLPDLITLTPSDVDVVQVEAGRGRSRTVETRLRLSNQIANVGEGRLEMYAVSGDCDGDGDVRNNRLIMQRFYDSAGAISSGDDSEVGCSIFHAKHQHWHMENFAKYELLDSGRNVVASAEKVSFCVIDTFRYENDAEDGPNYVWCGRSATLGISVGWGDEYGHTLDGQWIVITTVPDGEYCLLSTADPGNGIDESNETNNAAGLSVTLSTVSGVRTATTGGPCS